MNWNFKGFCKRHVSQAQFLCGSYWQVGNLQNLSSGTFLLSQKFGERNNELSFYINPPLLGRKFLYKGKDGELNPSPIFSVAVHYGKAGDGIGMPYSIWTSNSSKLMVVERHFFVPLYITDCITVTLAFCKFIFWYNGGMCDVCQSISVSPLIRNNSLESYQ